MRKQLGLTLVELMISILLGLILMMGVIQMFMGSKNTFYAQQSLSRVQETGRFAVEHLTRDIRMAGYSGCFSRFPTPGTGPGTIPFGVDSTLNDKSVFRWDYETYIKGYIYTGTALDFMHGTTGAGITPLSNTDVLVISSATGTGVVVSKNNDGGQLFASSTAADKNPCTATDKCGGFGEGDILIVTDCQKARIFQATNISVASGELNIKHVAAGTPGNAISSWGGAKPDKLFETGSEIIQMRKVIYYIKNNTAGIPSLYQWDNGVDSELVEGVEDMDLTFGQDTDGDAVPNAYYSSTAVTSWPQVVSVHAELLVRSAETNLLPEAQSYKFPLSATTAVSAPDKAMRQVFTVTTGIRSRLP